MPHLLSFKPYLFYAYYNWFVSSGITPHLMVNTSIKGVEVPMDYVHDHHIVLSIAESAVKDFCAGPTCLTFKANMAIPLGAALTALDISESQQDDEKKALEDENSGVEFVSDDSTEKGDDNNDGEVISSGFEFVDDDDEKK